jgi:hypothetical protein
MTNEPKNPVLTKEAFEALKKTASYNMQHKICQHENGYCSVQTSPKKSDCCGAPILNCECGTCPRCDICDEKCQAVSEKPQDKAKDLLEKMNNRFKFRHWDKHQKAMVGMKTSEVECLLWEEDLMQCTGLKDKNGKLIFERDIVKWQRQKESGDVFFKNARFWVRDFYLSWLDDPTDAFGENLINLEIIGNIYENPELFNQSQNV